MDRVSQSPPSLRRDVPVESCNYLAPCRKFGGRPSSQCYPKQEVVERDVTQAFWVPRGIETVVLAAGKLMTILALGQSVQAPGTPASQRPW